MKISQVTFLVTVLLTSQAAYSQQRASSIRSIDFNNFTYPSCIGTKGGVLSKAKRISLKSGEFEAGDLRRNEEPVSISLSNVSYHDLTGDEVEEAIVTIGYLFYPHGSAGCTFVYTLKEGRPKLLLQEASGDLRRLAVEGGDLIFERYVYSSADAHCCPEKFERSRHRWSGRRFAQGKSEVFANQNKQNKFLGYP